MTRLVLFDGNAVLHRAFHALPSLTSKNGEPIQAVYGMVSMMLRVIEDLSPTHIAFVFDTPKPTFRKVLHSEYQGNRPEMQDDLSSQFEKAYKILSSFKIPVYSKEGFEADDVIATIADASQVDEVLIVTGDRDMLQLINSKIKLYMPEKGLSQGKLYGVEETKARMGVLPTQIADLKALMGDASDNYKGVPGVGPKTAVDLLTKYQTLNGVYEHLEELKPRIKNLLVEHRDSADLSYKLATIVKDVDVDFKLEDMQLVKKASAELLSVCDEFGFKTLKVRIETVFNESV